MILPSGPLLLNINKPVGPTSSDVTSHFKRNLPKGQVKKIGHLGTLDPFADGVLLIGLNGGARFADPVHEFLPKTYRATGKWGTSTTTGDLSGEIKDESAARPSLKVRELELLWQQKFLKEEYWQAPPSFSAAKHQGKALYQWAREGVLIEKPAVKREIFSIEIIELTEDSLVFECQVGSGTYIRTLFEDMAQLIGCHGHLTKLSRLAIGGAVVGEAISEKDWPIREREYPELTFLRPWDVLTLPFMDLDEDRSKNYAQGQRLGIEMTLSGNCWVRSHSGEILGLANCENGSLISRSNIAHL
jgi:tRNA pseudouridine55 synthase